MTDEGSLDEVLYSIHEAGVVLVFFLAHFTPFGHERLRHVRILEHVHYLDSEGRVGLFAQIVAFLEVHFVHVCYHVINPFLLHNA